MRFFIRMLVSSVLGLALWLPFVHCFFEPGRDALPHAEGAVSSQARELADGLLADWGNAESREQALDKMARSNPEWGFMERTFLTLGFTNMALREPSRQAEYLAIVDETIADTLRREKEAGPEQYLMAYGRAGGWIVRPGRSAMVDGEMALMLGARRLVRERPDYRQPMQERLETTRRRMEASPVLWAESYPDECWLFCNSVTLAAMRMSDVLDGTDHRDFFRRWLAAAKARLTEPGTGLLIATCHVDGRPAAAGPGPEGSSTWLSTQMLDLVDSKFASDQYARTRRALGRTGLGFGFSREWPVGLEGSEDIDSGLVLPWLGASAPASGLAMVGAAGFRDEPFLLNLLATLELGGCPVHKNGRLRYAAGNPVGDAVLLYALTLGPLWDQIKTTPAGARSASQ